MDLHLHAGEPGSHVIEVYRQLREAIVTGRLRANDRLPPTRTLAADLGVARATVTAVYERLVAEGLAEGRTGSGTFVSATVQPLHRRSGRAVASRTRVPAGIELPVAPAPDRPAAMRHDLRLGRPDPALAPLREWRKLMVAALSRSDLLRAPYHAAGEPELREAIAAHLGRSRGMALDAQDVVITRGTGQALDLIARGLLRPGARVVMESPGYPDAYAAFAAAGARIVGVPVDVEGLDIERLPATATLLYCTPSHQAPTGAVLSLSRRIALLEWARRTGAWIIEDDYDTEYRWEQRVLDPLRTLDGSGRVIYLGSISKVLTPRVRVGWVAATPEVRAAMLRIKGWSDPFGERPVQLAMARFIDDGRLALHVRRSAATYGTRRAVTLQNVGTHLPDLAVVPGAAGLHIALTYPAATGRSRARGARVLAELTEACAARGIAIRTIRQVAATVEPHACEGLVVGFGAIPAASLPEAIAGVASCLAEIA